MQKNVKYCLKACNFCVSAVALLLLAFLEFHSSCRKDDLYTGKDARLEFNNDTVLFDTIFTTLGSVTKKFLVFNNYDKSLRISNIRLAGGKYSSFRLNIDGQPATEMKDVDLLPHDSLYIFVDVTIDPNSADLPFIVKDSVEFLTNGNFQYVRLMAWGQNAHFLHDSMLACNAVWTPDLPYVISNHIGIDVNCKLTIQPGVKVYSDINSAILVWGTMEVNGDTGNTVLFTGIRQDKYYKDVPGQWYGIYFLRESKENRISNALIRNAVFGVRVDSLPVTSNPNLYLENVRIENMSVAGILGFSSRIEAFNCVVSNSCQYLVACDYGGTYSFYHCTFSHEGCNCSSHYPAIACYNTDNKTFINDLNLTIRNSIVYGPKEDEFEVKKTGQGNVYVLVANSLLTTKQSGLNINGNILNKDPKFRQKCRYSYELDSASVCIDAADPAVVSQFPALQYDLLGKPREILKPDMGAVEKQK